MILNAPTGSDFETIAKENLTQAFSLLYKVYDNYIGYENTITEDEVSLESLWSHNNGTIRTALILLHQAIEGLMKAAICQTSPLLLIDKPRKEWPTLPESEDKEFDNLYTIGGEALLNTFCAIQSGISRTADLINFIEDVRQKRNRAIHGTNIKNVTPKYIIENILRTFTTWFGKDVWHEELVNNILENPLFGYFDADYESKISYRFLDFAMLLLGKGILSKHVSADIKGRQYFCPNCKEGIEHDFDRLESKWAFLSPNKPDSTTVLCVNCRETFVVKREKCIVKGCKGNVLYEDADYFGGNVCLTCFTTNEFKKE